MNYVGEKPADVLTLDLYPYGNTSFNLYEDDGLTRDYKKGEFARTLISVSSPKGEKGTITVDIAKAKGDYKGRYQERTGCPLRIQPVKRNRSREAAICHLPRSVQCRTRRLVLRCLGPYGKG